MNLSNLDLNKCSLANFNAAISFMHSNLTGCRAHNANLRNCNFQEVKGFEAINGRGGQFFFKCITNTTTIEGARDYTIRQIQKNIEDKTGMLIKEQRLFFNMKTLDPNKKLLDYDIQPMDTISILRK